MKTNKTSGQQAESDPAPLPEIMMRPVMNEKDLGLAKEIMTEYMETFKLHDYYQDLEEELNHLQQHYDLPENGMILLAFVEDILAGCAAVRPMVDADYINACEMKRLYVRPAFRGFGIGRQLAETLLEYGKTVGYTVMLLDTISEQESARALYKALNFEEIPPYYYSPIPGSHYLKVDLG